jgi:hypothetical protein
MDDDDNTIVDDAVEKEYISLELLLLISVKGTILNFVEYNFPFLLMGTSTLGGAVYTEELLSGRNDR